ncbi:exosortase-associated protein EpsI, V-type [Sphingomonas sp. Ag1]|jgi:EpsI family protein|uniref:exosortase-associated protein EpsI, V-type n=1 Tax=Sphingomonas sp. Ag1 TaxID=1642949 RepID=UPI000AE8633E|nr:exosortase-associated protein EpsI, V-type [Sphingomonas sp. Ag1]
MSRARPPGISLSRRDAFLGCALLATAGLSWGGLPRERVVALPNGDADDVLPTSIGTWELAPAIDFIMPPDDERQAAAVYEDQVTRTFVNGVDPAIMFVLAYDRRQSGMLMVHRPESCYPGSGFTITSDRPVDIPLAPGLMPRGRFLSTQRDERVEQVLYWTRLGNEFPQSWDEERHFLAAQNLRGIAPDGTLVRVSSVDLDPESAYARLTQFAAAMYATAGRNGRALLAGPANV